MLESIKTGSCELFISSSSVCHGCCTLVSQGGSCRGVIVWEAIVCGVVFWGTIVLVGSCPRGQLSRGQLSREQLSRKGTRLLTNVCHHIFEKPIALTYI